MLSAACRNITEMDHLLHAIEHFTAVLLFALRAPSHAIFRHRNLSFALRGGRVTHYTPRGHVTCRKRHSMFRRCSFARCRHSSRTLSRHCALSCAVRGVRFERDMRSRRRRSSLTPADEAFTLVSGTLLQPLQPASLSERCAHGAGHEPAVPWALASHLQTAAPIYKGTCVCCAAPVLSRARTQPSA